MTSLSRHPATMSAAAVSRQHHSAAPLLATAFFIAAATLLQSVAVVASASSAAEHTGFAVGTVHQLPIEPEAVGQQRKKETTLADDLAVPDPRQADVDNKEQIEYRLAERAAEIELRPKRDWKSSRAQAAWGKRANTGAGTSDESASQEADARRRRKWNQSRQAWGKRAEDGESELGDDKLEEYANRGIGWNKRKWGSANVKTAWGKRKWGASNDMRVWGKRFVVADDSAQNELDDTDEHEFEETSGHRFRRSINQDNDNWVPHFQGAVRRHRSPSSSGTRVYIGPKRNWQTNTMKVWGKRSSGNDDVVDGDDWLSGTADDENENVEETNDEANDYSSWKGAGISFGSAGTRPLRPVPVSWKRGWSGDNSLRVWG